MSEEFLALPLEDVLELVSRDELNELEEQVCRAESAGDTWGCCSFSFLEKVNQNTVCSSWCGCPAVAYGFAYHTICMFHENLFPTHFRI